MLPDVVVTSYLSCRSIEFIFLDFRNLVTLYNLFKYMSLVTLTYELLYLMACHKYIYIQIK